MKAAGKRFADKIPLPVIKQPLRCWIMITECISTKAMLQQWPLHEVCPQNSEFEVFSISETLPVTLMLSNLHINFNQAKTNN